jgi:hypothetical protein
LFVACGSTWWKKAVGIDVISLTKKFVIDEAESGWRGHRSAGQTRCCLALANWHWPPAPLLPGNPKPIAFLHYDYTHEINQIHA